jgi:hypothetical protein
MQNDTIKENKKKSEFSKFNYFGNGLVFAKKESGF